MDEQTVISVSANVYAVAAFVGYLLFLVGIGIYSMRFSSGGLSEYFIGGRKMSRFVVALSAVVSGRSSWLLLGVTGLAYMRGFSAVWAVAGYIAVELLLFLYYAPRLRNFSEVHDCITVPDFFADRLEDHNGSLRKLLIGILVVFMVSYVSAQFVAGGKAFASGFGLNQMSGIFLTAAIVLMYTVLGGFLAVSLTDMFQAIFMLFALVVLPWMAIWNTGGWAVFLNEVAAIDATLPDPLAIGAGALAGFLGIGLGSPGNPHILARYMSIDDAKQLRWSAVVGTLWNVLMAAGAVVIGVAGRTYFPEIDMLPASDEENVYPVLAQQLLHPAIFGIIIASIFAAIMSTADSMLLVAASSLVRDLYDKLVRKGEEISQKKLVLYSRSVVVLLVIASLIFGLLAQDLVFWLVLFAWAGLGASLGPTSILALYWKHTTKTGVMAGLITGTMVVMVWYNIPVLKNAMYELIPAFILSTLVTIIVSRFTQPPEQADKLMEDMDG